MVLSNLFKVWLALWHFVGVKFSKGVFLREHPIAQFVQLIKGIISPRKRVGKPLKLMVGLPFLEIVIEGILVMEAVLCVLASHKLENAQTVGFLVKCFDKMLKI